YPALPRFVGVVGLHFTQQSRRFDPAARAIRPAAGSTTRAGTDAAAITFAEAGAFAGAGSASASGPTTLSFDGCLRQHAGAIPRVGGRDDDRRDHRGKRLGFERRF